MNPKCLLVTIPSVDFNALTNVSQHVLGYSLLRTAAQSAHELSEPEKLLSCLATLGDQKMPVSFAPHLLAHLMAGVCVVADERDLYAMLERCAGMASVTAETTVRGVLLAIVSGTLAQWRDAVVAGCSRDAEPSLRVGFNAIHRLLCNAGMNVWQNYRVAEAADQTLLLEYKPK